MGEAVPMELVIAEMEISEISENELENTFQRVVMAHRDAVKSIQASMKDADDAYRKYLDPAYVPLEDVAKKDRAILNKAEKNIQEQFAMLIDAYEKPMQNTEENIKRIRKAIKDASGVVDSAVKKEEEKQKSKKREEIQAYFDGKDFSLVPLEKIFDARWLNKGTKISEIKEQIDEKIKTIYRDIEVLEKIQDHGVAAKSFYLESLDMGAALRQVDILKENAARILREQESREARKTQNVVSGNAVSLRKEEQEAAKEESVHNLVDQALGIPEGTTAAQEKAEIMEYTLQFSGTKEQLFKLRQYMTEQGIPYKKLLIFRTENDAAIYRQNQRINGDIKSAVLLSVEAVA